MSGPIVSSKSLKTGVIFHTNYLQCEISRQMCRQESLCNSRTTKFQLYFSFSIMSELKQILSPDKEIKIIKWIIHKGSQISNGSVLCLFQSPSGSDKVERLKNTACGLVKKLLCKEGTIIAKK